MIKRALHSVYSLEKRVKRLEWKNFKMEVRRTFRLSNYDQQIRKKLSQVKQRNNINYYFIKFILKMAASSNNHKLLYSFINPDSQVEQFFL